MSKVIQRVEVTLRSFYIFNSSFGKKEGEEHKKILYYHPNGIEENTKIKDVGLSEAIIAFTETFTSDNDCKALHTQKTTQLFYQPEIDYWLVMTLNVPKEIRLKDGVEVADYRGGEINDNIYSSILTQCYRMFRLLAGSIKMNYELNGLTNDEAREQLQQKLAIFFDKYLNSLKLPACDILDTICSIQYLPLEKSLFLRSHNFINMVRATFLNISDIVFFYNEQVVCSGKINAIDLYSLHEYVMGKLVPKDSQNEVNNTLFTRSSSTTSETNRNGAFVSVTDNDEDNSNPTQVYLLKDDELIAYRLVVYKAKNATLCILIIDSAPLQNDFNEELHSYIGPQLSIIARDIGDKIAEVQKSSVHTPTPTTNNDIDTVAPKYLFVNEQSLKHLTNITVDKRRPKINPTMPLNVLNIVGSLMEGNRSYASTTSSSFEEVLLKTTNDFWIVKRKCNWRQYFVIIFNSKATLLDVTQEAKRIFEQELTDDVFFDK
ncbi:vacuolar fusion protein CCZ1 homolog [Teleopsis dalmanni]|uniref:vacuolar fusion protein CCZ1 homolog n=1 Tax=Teleopsis dalmanni TaxID=139649 RepID=UPI0018CD5BBB|nr:vacuolar fusion protein CCZ1 homolog [Teleopsis dalmanni]